MNFLDTDTCTDVQLPPKKLTGSFLREKKNNKLHLGVKN